MKKVPEWNYKFLRPLAIVLLKIIYQPKVINKQAIPKEGPIILAGNHKAYPDPVLVGSCTRRVIHFFIKDVYTNKIKIMYNISNSCCICERKRSQ